MNGLCRCRFGSRCRRRQAKRADLGRSRSPTANLPEMAKAAAEPAEAAPAHNARLEDVPDDVIALALARLSVTDLARAQQLSRRCHDVHVRDAEALVAERLEAAVAARGRRTVAAGVLHTVCVRGGAALSWGSGNDVSVSYTHLRAHET